MSNGSRLFKFQHANAVRELAYVSELNYLASGSSDSIRIWDLAAGTLKFVLNITDKDAYESLSTNVVVTSGSQLLAAGSNLGQIKVFDIGRGTLKLRLNATKGQTPVYALAFFGSELLCSGGGYWTYGPSLKVWNVSTGVLKHSLDAVNGSHTDSIVRLAVLERSRLLVSYSWDNTIKVWNLTLPDVILVRTILPFENACSVCTIELIVLGDKLIACGLFRYIKVYDVTTGELKIRIDELTGRYAYYVTALAFSSSGLLVSANQFPSVSVWNLTTGVAKFRFDAFSGGVNSSVNGLALIGEELIATGADDASIKIFGNNIF